MLRWLDSRTNHKRHPNENYARELMELFTLGIGNYGERDVQEAARAFTGWSEKDGAFAFDADAHDGGDKTVFGKTGTWDGADVVRLCYAQPAASRFLAGKLLRFFLHPEPPPEAIEAFAALIEQSGFDLRAPLATLFRSRAFHSQAAYRALVKSPVELLVGTLRALGQPLAGKSAAASVARMGQNLFLPPTVKGWSGQLSWISPGSLIARCRALAELSAAPPLEEAITLLLDGELDPAIRAGLASYARGDGVTPRDTLLALLLLPEYHVG
jgi:uncharacterized protein (DUF1800 family)